jgi:hypothetical protein
VASTKWIALSTLGAIEPAAKTPSHNLRRAWVVGIDQHPCHQGDDVFGAAMARQRFGNEIAEFALRLRDPDVGLPPGFSRMGNAAFGFGFAPRLANGPQRHGSRSRSGKSDGTPFEHSRRDIGG